MILRQELSFVCLINNYGNILNFAVALPVLWFSFAHRGGVYSLVWAMGIGYAFFNLFIAVFAYALGCLPHRHQWGRPAWHHFRELFGLGRDVFLMSLGSLLVNATQTMVITRVLGLEASAVWTVCTRVFNMALMLLYRIYDFSFGAFAEMYARGETARFLARFRSLVILSGSLAVWGGVLFALCNQPFVQIWTHGKVTWPRINDTLLGSWLVIQVIAHCHVGLVGVTKRFAFMRWIYFIEGLFFLVLSIPSLKFGGLSAMLCVSIVGTGSFSLAYSLMRSRKLFSLTWRELFRDWFTPTAVFAACLMVPAVVVVFLSHSLNPHLQLLFGVVVILIAGAGLLPRIGVDYGIKQVIHRRLPGTIARLLAGDPIYKEPRGQ